jgi:phage-related protein
MIIAYQIKQGAKFRLMAVGAQESEKVQLPFLDFQREAASREPREWPKLVRIMDHTADAGPPKDEEKSKLLREGIFEFRTKGGLRLLWFYDEGRVVICVNGYIKRGQKTPNAEIDAAIQWKNKYFDAKRSGTLKEIKIQ